MLEITALSIFKRYIWLIVRLLFGFLATILLARFFIISPGIVNGPSMQPSYPDNTLFLVNRFVYFFRQPQRYDVAQIIDPASQKLIIKRIIGLPGEVIYIKQGKVFRQLSDGASEELDESAYLDAGVFTDIPSITEKRVFIIPAFSYFVLGDNRSNSVDSRYYGPIPRSRIVGKIFWK